MKLDFNSMEEQELKNFKGGEKSVFARMYFDGKTRIMIGRMEKGASIGMHTHETSSETVFVLSGTGTMIYDGETETLEKGTCSFCPIGHTHSLMNNAEEPLIFAAVVPELK